MILRNRSLKDFIPFAPYILGALVVFIAAVSGFVSLAEEVREGEALVVDARILEAVNRLSTPWLDRFFTAVTWLGDVIFVTAVTLVTCAVLVKKRVYRAVAIVISSVLGAVLISHVLKLILARPRPELWEALVHVSTFSFPSGHAIASSALAFTMIYLLWQTKWRRASLAIGSLYVALVGFSRLYLGVHYPSDVVAAWLVSIAWFLVVVGVFNLWLTRQSGAVVNLRHE